MEYKQFENKIFLRIDRGEEILQSLKNVCEKENIKLASIAGIGATNNFTVGVYKVDEKKYYKNTFTGNFEIVSLLGTVTTKDGEFYSHLHFSAGNEKGLVFGGHLKEAFVSATCEVVIDICNGKVERKFDENIGLNLFKF